MSDPRERCVHPKEWIARVKRSGVLLPKADPDGDQVARSLASEKKFYSGRMGGFARRWENLQTTRDSYLWAWSAFWNQPEVPAIQLLSQHEKVPMQRDFFIYLLYCELRLALASQELERLINEYAPPSVVSRVGLKHLYPSFYGYFFSMSDQAEVAQLYSDKDRPYSGSSLAVLQKIARSLKREKREQLTLIEFRSLCSIFAQQLILEQLDNTRDVSLQLSHHLLLTSASVDRRAIHGLIKDADKFDFPEMMGLIQVFFLNFYRCLVDPSSDETSFQYAVEFWLKLSGNLVDPVHPDGLLTAFIMGLNAREVESGEISVRDWVHRLGESTSPIVSQLEFPLKHLIDTVGLQKMYMAETVRKVFAPLQFFFEAEPFIELCFQLTLHKEIVVEIGKEQLRSDDFVRADITGVRVGIRREREDLLNAFVQVRIGEGSETKHTTFAIDLHDRRLNIIPNLINAIDLPEKVISRLLHFVLLANFTQNTISDAPAGGDALFEHVVVNSGTNHGILPDVVVRTPGPAGRRKAPSSASQESEEAVATEDSPKRYRIILPTDKKALNTLFKGIDEPIRTQILRKIVTYNRTGAGETKQFVVKDKPKIGAVFWLRIGDYRVLAKIRDASEVEVFAVCHKDYEWLILHG